MYTADDAITDLTNDVDPAHVADRVDAALASSTPEDVDNWITRLICLADNQAWKPLDPPVDVSHEGVKIRIQAIRGSTTVRGKNVPTWAHEAVESYLAAFPHMTNLYVKILETNDQTSPSDISKAMDIYRAQYVARRDISRDLTILNVALRDKAWFKAWTERWQRNAMNKAK